jgi:hypothetical protein
MGIKLQDPDLHGPGTKKAFREIDGLGVKWEKDSWCFRKGKE